MIVGIKKITQKGIQMDLIVISLWLKNKVFLLSSKNGEFRS